jgi:hypothetical protein
MTVVASEPAGEHVFLVNRDLVRQYGKNHAIMSLEVQLRSPAPWNKALKPWGAMVANAEDIPAQPSYKRRSRL